MSEPITETGLFKCPVCGEHYALSWPDGCPNDGAQLVAVATAQSLS